MSRITTEKQQDILYLKGELDAHSLSDIWSIKNTLLKEVKKIDVAQLIRVDSSGLATLVYFCNKYNVTLDSVNPQLLTLIALYDLQPVILK